LTNVKLAAAQQYLITLGYLERSGEFQRAPTGELEPVYQISALGHIANLLHRERGLTFEEAMALAKSSFR
jgi:hypothetical protein